MKYLRSWQTGEGLSAYTVIALGGALIWFLISGEDSTNKVDELLKHAKTFQDVAEAYKQDAVDFSELLKSGEIVAILTYMYKTYAKLTDSRTVLKKKVIEQPEKKE